MNADQQTVPGALWPGDFAAAQVPSPALILHLDVVEENLRKMIDLAGGAHRLRPHVKTHKLPQLVKRQMDLGIHQFKCATLAEAAMCAGAGARDVLLARQPVGPDPTRLATLAKKSRRTTFSTIIDDSAALVALESAASAAGVRLTVLLDLNTGQDRSGIRPGPEAVALYQQIAAAKHLIPGGLHAYDGHITLTDTAARARACEDEWEPVESLRAELLRAGLPVPLVVAGGSPAFPTHAARAEVQCSPGTTVLWDAGYAARFPDLPFRPAAWLLTRVISRPAPGLLCLDLGHKAVASEMPHPRVVFPALPDAVAFSHSEEHLVLRVAEETVRAFPVGTPLTGIPQHVCPTMALYNEVWPLARGQLGKPWPVSRGRLVPGL